MTTLAAEFDRSAVTSARAAAAAAAARSGVVVEQAHESGGLAAIGSVVDAIWHPTAGGEPLSPLILRAFEHTGNYCAIARLDDQVVGACVGFLAVEPAGCLHSHLAGVTLAAAGRHVGFALKLDQRAWALEHGMSSVEWTFDPLVRRNAYFNCAKLGAVPTAYLTDFYGAMHDRTNVGQGSDRLVATWKLLDQRVLHAADGDHPTDLAADLLARPDTVVVLDAMGDRPVRRHPAEVRHAHSAGAHPRGHRRDPAARPRPGPAWRYAARQALTGLLSDGWSITGMTRDGCYVLNRD